MNIPSSWQGILCEELTQTYFVDLSTWLQHERNQFTVFPSDEQTFSALVMTPPEKVRVVILGQDPYHGAGQAHGLSFSVQRGTRTPPSLRNIYTELRNDLDIAIPNHGNLESWAHQGVLLLNTTLTVREGEPGSHAGLGWEQLTDAVISYLGSLQEHVVFVLWGSHAQKKSVLIHAHHTIIKSAHPSPLSAHRGFFGSRPFSRVNQALRAHSQSEIDWQLR